MKKRLFKLLSLLCVLSFVLTSLSVIAEDANPAIDFSNNLTVDKENNESDDISNSTTTYEIIGELYVC